MESPQILIDTSIYLKSKNQLISPPDIVIAATAISHNLSLVTLNKLQKDAARNRFRDAWKRYNSEIQRGWTCGNYGIECF